MFVSNDILALLSFLAHLAACTLQVIVPTLPDIDPASIAASDKAGGMRYPHSSYPVDVNERVGEQ